MKPERRLFRVEAGEYVESETGAVRDCFPIQITEPRGVVAGDLRRRHRFRVRLGHNADFALDYLVSGQPDGRFEAHDIESINRFYGAELYAFAKEPEIEEHAAGDLGFEAPQVEENAWGLKCPRCGYRGSIGVYGLTCAVNVGKQVEAVDILDGVSTRNLIVFCNACDCEGSWAEFGGDH